MCTKGWDTGWSSPVSRYLGVLWDLVQGVGAEGGEWKDGQGEGRGGELKYSSHYYPPNPLAWCPSLLQPVE